MSRSLARDPHQSPRLGIRTAAVLATMAVIALGAGTGETATATASAAPPATTPSDSPCHPSSQGPSDARVRAGGTGSDPNSVSAARAAAMESALQQSVSKMQQNGTLDRSGNPSAKSAKSYTVQTYVHVITKKNGTGAVSLGQIQAQIDVLNKAYAGQTAAGSAATPFRFAVTSVDVTKNNDWYDWSLDNDTDNAEAKAALHKGTWADLNLYITGLQDGLLGYATFPSAKKLKDDGVVMLNDSLPGGAAAPYNEGDTATHEIGHWLGLFHTFQGGCKAPGDHVNDTPYQADGDNIYFCRESDDTCRQPGKDPVHNFMSYGDDPCLDQFTPGQSKRMTQAWMAFRRGR